MNSSSAGGSENSVPQAFLESSGAIASELREPILFGERAYYLPSEDLARLSASYDTIRDVHGKEAADRFALNIRTKAQYYRESAQELNKEIASLSLDPSGDTDAERVALIERHYLAARRSSAERDLEGAQSLSSVQPAELGKKFKNHETSVLVQTEKGTYRGRTLWVTDTAFSDASRSELSDRGLQNPNKLNRYYDQKNQPKNAAVLNFTVAQTIENFDVVDPDSSEARDYEVQHIPFGYSSGGWREFTITPKKGYVDQVVVTESKGRVTNVAAINSGINIRVNQDVFGHDLEGVQFRKTLQSKESALSLSFEYEKSPYNVSKYEKDITRRLKQAETAKEGKFSSGEAVQKATEETTPPTKGSPEESAAQAKSRYLESMEKNVRGKGAAKNKGAAPIV
jgi:hypothetical protein